MYRKEDGMSKFLDEQIILDEIADHIAYWKSDRCKRSTVEHHLSESPREVHPNRKPMQDVTKKIDALIAAGKVVRVPGRTGDYLMLPKT